MKHLWTLLVLVAAAINLAPLLGSVSAERMSVFYGVLTPETGELEYVCAGHPFPLLRRARGAIEELGSGGFPLGIREPLEVCRRNVTLQPGDLLLLYTDGLPEAVDATAKTAFGYERIQAALELGCLLPDEARGVVRLDDRAASMPINQVVAEPRGGERPQPVGDAADAPTGFIGVFDWSASILREQSLHDFFKALRQLVEGRP